MGAKFGVLRYFIWLLRGVKKLSIQDFENAE